MKKVTINDVAKAAGVSKGTVDRVLHNRGEVSEQSWKKVINVIEKLGYIPNMHASLLASRKNFRIVCLLPEFSKGEFWELTEKGMSQGQEYAAHYGIDIISVKYDQYDLSSFQKACIKVLDSAPSAVILAPMFRNETLKFVNTLKTIQIPYVFIDSKLEEDGYLAYYGMPMYQSGYLCADILTMEREIKRIHIVRIERDKMGLSDPTQMRRMGFLDYISEHYPNCIVDNTFIDPKDEDSRYRRLDALFAEDTEPEKYIVMFNSRVYLVADYLKTKGISTCRVVGFDVLERNLTLLREGYVQALIAQRPDKQLIAAITTLADRLVIQKSPARKDNYAHMDIINRYNCDYYYNL